MPDSAAVVVHDEDVRGVQCTVYQGSDDFLVTRDDDDRARPCVAAVAVPVPFAPFADTLLVPDKAPGTVDEVELVRAMAVLSPLRLAFATLCPEPDAASLAL